MRGTVAYKIPRSKTYGAQDGCGDDKRRAIENNNFKLSVIAAAAPGYDDRLVVQYDKRRENQVVSSLAEVMAIRCRRSDRMMSKVATATPAVALIVWQCEQHDNNNHGFGRRLDECNAAPMAGWMDGWMQPGQAAKPQQSSTTALVRSVPDRILDQPDHSS
ncbi:unnamed protein product [Anisakis simplex]|uniref:Transposase n=1 Tax=Anisakis simplex TaxID=6269 RepID=A0A0M3JVL8_ANISI|nr:unnamed protein product [Anisakis simplex]